MMYGDTRMDLQAFCLQTVKHIFLIPHNIFPDILLEYNNQSSMNQRFFNFTALSISRTTRLTDGLKSAGQKRNDVLHLNDIYLASENNFEEWSQKYL